MPKITTRNPEVVKPQFTHIEMLEQTGKGFYRKQFKGEEVFLIKRGNVVIFTKDKFDIVTIEDFRGWSIKDPLFMYEPGTVSIEINL